MKYLIIVVISLGILGGGYYFVSKNNSPNQPTAQNNPAQKTDNNAETTEAQNGSMQFSPTGTKISGHYYQYSKVDYEAAKAAGRPIFLYFYANWCPTCAQQEPIVQALMKEIENESQLDDLVAFRVNFNDNETDNDEKLLAREFGVTYQHTMFTLDEDGNQVQKLLGQTSQEALKAAFQKAVDA
jgi:thiol:disulfide interchange protein